VAWARKACNRMMRELASSQLWASEMVRSEVRSGGSRARSAPSSAMRGRGAAAGQGVSSAGIRGCVEDEGGEAGGGRDVPSREPGSSHSTRRRWLQMSMPTFLAPALSNDPPITSSPPSLPPSPRPSSRALALRISSRRPSSALASFLTLGASDPASSAADVANSEAEARSEMRSAYEASSSSRRKKVVAVELRTPSFVWPRVPNHHLPCARPRRGASGWEGSAASGRERAGQKSKGDVQQTRA